MEELLLARQADLDQLVDCAAELYRHEHIPFEPAVARRALAALIDDPTLGRVWLIAIDGKPVGYLVIAFGYSIEYGRARRAAGRAVRDRGPAWAGPRHASPAVRGGRMPQARPACPAFRSGASEPRSPTPVPRRGLRRSRSLPHVVAAVTEIGNVRVGWMPKVNTPACAPGSRSDSHQHPSPASYGDVVGPQIR